MTTILEFLTFCAFMLFMIYGPALLYLAVTGEYMEF